MMIYEQARGRVKSSNIKKKGHCEKLKLIHANSELTVYSGHGNEVLRGRHLDGPKSWGTTKKEKKRNVRFIDY